MIQFDKNLGEDGNADADFEKYKLLAFRVYEKKIEDVYRVLRENGIEAILIKGWAAAENYPKPYLRPIGDIDLAVSPDELVRAAPLLKPLGAAGEIDLHGGLRHLDALGWEDLFENSRLEKCLQTPIRILRPEDHLRVLCVHWLNDGGANREKLWDIYYAVANRPADFDWNRCLNVVDAKRKRWIACAVGLAHRHLNLNLENTPFAAETIQIPQWLTKAVEKEWQSGDRLMPLEACLADKRQFWRQIRKRLPPNAVQATIEMDGEFDDCPRLRYQLGDFFYRLAPSVKRLTKVFLTRIARKKRETK